MYESLRGSALDVILTDDLQLRLVQDLHGSPDHRRNQPRQETESLGHSPDRLLSSTNHSFLPNVLPQVTIRDFLFHVDNRSLLLVYVVYISQLNATLQSTTPAYLHATRSEFKSIQSPPMLMIECPRYQQLTIHLVTEPPIVLSYQSRHHQQVELYLGSRHSNIIKSNWILTPV